MRPVRRLPLLTLLLLGGLSLLGCVRVEVQRTIAPASASPTPVRTVQPATRATPTPVAQHTAPREPQPIPRSLFRLRMPPPTALAIPRLGIDVPVTEVTSVVDERGWHWPVPSEAAAHLVGTANPGEPGNIAITGHVDTERGPGIFWKLLDVRPGDEITVWSALGSFTYRVTDVRVVPQDDRSVLQQTPREVLTLLTCVPDGRYTQRLVVRAEPVEPALAQR